MKEYLDEILAALAKVPGYPSDEKRDRQWLTELIQEEGFGLNVIDLVVEARTWKAYILDKPFSKNSKPRAQFRTWIGHSIEWGRAKPRAVVAPSLTVAEQLEQQRARRQAEMSARGIRFEN